VSVGHMLVVFHKGTWVYGVLRDAAKPGLSWTPEVVADDEKHDGCLR